MRIAPVANDRGDYALIASATDVGQNGAAARTVTYTFNVSVESDNEAPVIAYVGEVVAVAGETMRVPITVADMDEDDLAFVIAGLPGATISEGASYGQAMVEWTPTAAQLGEHMATVTVTDSGNGLTAPASAATGFKVIVRTANAAPQIAPVGDKDVTEGANLAFTLRGVDPDGDVLTFRMLGAPDGAVARPGDRRFQLDAAQQRRRRLCRHLQRDRRPFDQQRDGDADRRQRRTRRRSSCRSACSSCARTPTWCSASSAATPTASRCSTRSSRACQQGALFVPARGEFQWTPGFDQAGDHTVQVPRASIRAAR